MDTSESLSADVKLTDRITESDILTWLRTRADEESIKGLVVTADGTKSLYPWYVKIDTDPNAFGCGRTVAAAVEMIRPSIKTPEQIAEAKRAAAAKLLAEADALVPLSIGQSIGIATEAAERSQVDCFTGTLGGEKGASA